MSRTWSESASAYLARTDICPRCDRAITAAGRCVTCHTVLDGEPAARVVAASLAVIDALTARQALVDALPRFEVPVPVVAPAAARATVIPAREGSTISVQSVLAVVGAALLAVAAIVFTFLNPDLTNFATRTAIVAVTTAIFLGGAWLLARAGLRFSAEAIGALGMVFVVLDVWAFSHSAPRGISPYVFAGIGTIVAALVMIAIAVAVRIRTWLWLGLLGFAISPAWFGYAGHSPWGPIVGHLGVGATAVAVHEIARRLGRRFDSGLRADRWMATVLELVVFVVVVVQLLPLLGQPNAVGSAAVLATLAALATASTRNQLPAAWSLLAGILFTLAGVELAMALTLADGNWLAAIVPLCAAAMLVILSAATRLRGAAGVRVSRDFLVGGSMLAASACTAFTLGAAGLQFVPPLARYLPPTLGLASSIGLAATAAGLLAAWAFTADRVRHAVRDGSALAALCLALASLISFTGWEALSNTARLSISLIGAVALSALLLGVHQARDARPSARLPLTVGAHLLVIHAATVAWSSPVLSEVGGTAVVVSLAALTLVVPRILRPIHTAVGFAYALVVFAHSLQLAHLPTIALFCITTALASAVALAVTVVRRIPARYWYAVLIVTAVPFIIGIVTVLFVRSGWTALSTGVTFALALTLVVTNRPGLSRYLRAIAAALLIPALAVVVVCLGAQVLLVSASPITLPVIAVIVACTLPSTELVGAALRRRGLPEVDVRMVRLAIEASTLLTGALAVALALVRAAAGLDTSFLVLLIIGVGAAATALISRRRYGWIVAAASWTGALWCFWGILGIQVLEPYLLPPAVAAAIIGAVAVLRKLPGLGLYAVGLACAILPSLVVLAGWGNGGDIQWRAYGLLASSLLLLAAGATASRRRKGSRVRALGAPTLVVAIAAATAGPIEAIRTALGFDRPWAASSQPLTVSVLELGVLAAVLAAVAARFLITPERLSRSRWRCVYMPAVIFLVAGPIAAIRPGWLAVWILFGLTLALLAMMIATAVRSRAGAVSLPPVWFLFGVAWCTAVAGWSDRNLRVEAFSLPLGLALLAVGVLALGPATARGRSLTSWPTGFEGSWWLLTPGIVATFLPSILATGTDPQTLRAILVIAFALLAILVGSLRRLGAPFLLGIIVLPLENITVFAAQIGHTISATSWWITLATAGAVLLVIAVSYERRSGGERGVAARIRDLR